MALAILFRLQPQDHVGRQVASQVTDHQRQRIAVIGWQGPSPAGGRARDDAHHVPQQGVVGWMLNVGFYQRCVRAVRGSVSS